MDLPGRWAAGAVVAALALVGGATAAPAPKDYAAIAWNVLPPGQAGEPDSNDATDQISLYDGLTPLFDGVQARHLRRYFKSARFGVAGAGPVRVERTGRAGLQLLRDRWGVPHVYGKTRADVMFGAGWATAHDRGLLIALLRYPGRLAAVDAPGINAFSLVGTTRRFLPSAETEASLDAGFDLLRTRGPRGVRVIRDVQAYLAGINAYNRIHNPGVPPWTGRDIASVVAVLAAAFGGGGGDEVRRSQFLDVLQTRLGAEAGRAVWEDLRERDDPESLPAVDGRFPYDTPAQSGAGNVVVDDGSFEPVAYAGGGPATATWSALSGMSNALLVSARRSANGHPLFVAGPQVGYFFPGLLMELDLHGGGIDARGASVPGFAHVLVIGRGKDYSWSLTSGGSDVTDTFVETLCDDDVHYRFQGSCREMGRFDAGTLTGGDLPDQRVIFRTTVHGPVVGYATVAGRRVAISRKRSTAGRGFLSTIPFQDLQENRVTSARSFLRTMGALEFSFNAVYADHRDIAVYSAGRLPIRAPSVEGGLPTVGTGEFEWRGFLPAGRHPQGINPRAGVLVNWNNKPARGFAAADDNWTFGSVQRVDLLSRALSSRRTHTPTSVVAAMNKAATQDLRTVEVWPAIKAVLQTGPAPSPRAADVVGAIDAWRAAGSSRLDRDLDGMIDHPGAAAMDAAWPRIADAVMSPVLGPLVNRLAGLIPRDEPPNTQGSAYQEGWYGYVDKDLRALLGLPVAAPFRTRFCGAGEVAACRASLWAAIDAAAAQLETVHGLAGPVAWRANATAERIRFAGFLPRSMRWSNRPTFQQVLSFRGHR